MWRASTTISATSGTIYLTYRDFKLVNLTSNQVDVGGVLPGGTFGIPNATAPRPQQPSVWTTGMTTTINPTTTNSFVFSYLRQFWQWSDDNGPAQLPGLGGALEIGGESSNALIPYNVNTQSVRQRFWDGQDKQMRDDLTMLKGNHLFGFGGSYARNFDYHSRTDNGAGVNNQISYLSTSSGFNWTSPTRPIHPQHGAVFAVLHLGNQLRRSPRHAELKPGDVHARRAAA